MQWYKSGSEAALVECVKQRWVYTIGMSLAGDQGIGRRLGMGVGVGERHQEEQVEGD